MELARVVAYLQFRVVQAPAADVLPGGAGVVHGVAEVGEHLQ